MMLRTFTFSLLLVFLVLISLSYGQAQSIESLKQQAMNTQYLTLTQGDSVVEVRIAPTAKGANIAKADRYYWWLGAGEIKGTQGGYGGRLLDGKYALYNRSKDLLESGQHAGGLRVGEWRGWYADGTLRYADNWKDGLRAGGFTEYDLHGNITREGRYRKGRLHGGVNTYNDQGERTQYRYRNGELLKTKVKKEGRFKVSLRPSALYNSLKEKLKFRKGVTDADITGNQVQTVPEKPTTDSINEGKDEKKKWFRLPFSKKAKK